MTSLGATLLGSSEVGTLVVRSSGMTVPASAGGWDLMPLGSTAQEKQLCRGFDKKLCGAFGCEEIPSAAAESGPGEVVGARALSLVRFAIGGDGTLSVRDAVDLDAPVDALRLYRERAYSVGRSWEGDRRDVIDLGANLELAGQHDVAEWVTRQDAGVTRARLRNNHVELAKVVP